MSQTTPPTLHTARTEPEDGQYDAPSNQPLLLSLEQGGSRWPSSCRNGTCRSCIGRLMSGQIRYEIEWPGLTKEEQAEGYVLPCVAFPCADVVVREGW